MASARFHLTFPEHLLREPMVYRIGNEFSLRTNIRRANVEERSAWFIMDFEGEDADIERAVAWLEGEGVQIDRLPVES